ncbi:hypothetical protein [Glutamicibacter sp. NPDC087583]|uniref:hypothetical protein n=1 Tax=Glutamicibacter sp. NPDC087583 TaxID=3363995 RepID=UPI0038157738
MTKNPLQPIIDAAWNWVLARLGEDRVRELAGSLEPTREALAATYPEALEPQEGNPIHWNEWSKLTIRSRNARTLLHNALGGALGDLIKGDLVPLPIADAAYKLEDESQKPRDPGRSSLDD